MKLVPVKSKDDVFPQFKNSPIEKLFDYHNLSHPFENCKKAELLVGMCMDNRKYLHIPDNFAYILRSGGANFRNNEFKISYAIAIGNIKTLALVGHNHCGMVNLISRKKKFIDGLIKNAGWNKFDAEKHFWENAPRFEIGSEINFIVGECERLRFCYPKILVAPLFFNVDDNLLYQIKEK